MKEEKQEIANRIFRRFSPFIRDYIYRNGWTELRQVQIEAADLIFHRDCNLLISSETASGKTEAALFPLLSLMEEESPEQFQILYISPLKSLINDQFSRMEELLQESGLPVHRWHGDISRSHKESFLKKPCGLIQITPESLESMLCRRYNDIPRIFGNLRVVILDEVHALMGTDRGNQILCQLQRIARLISYSPRRIALSATVGDCTGAAEWLGSGSERNTEAINIPGENASWRLALEHFYTTEKTETKTVDAAGEFIYRSTKGEKCVVFSNSREETENITATLREIAKKKGEEDRFLIHHGNLSGTIREETESILKNDQKAVCACATVTLELGIDIGKLKRIVNQGSPTSVSGFLQRIGRSGRRNEPPEMLMVFREEEPLPNAPLFQLIPWDLIQAIAIIQLYREERWIEPARKKNFPASLLFHQTLSVLSTSGGISAAKLASRVLSLAPFSAVNKEEYKELLTHMLKERYLELTEEKDLIVGLKGEKLLQSFKFYAVFKDSEDFTVRCGSEEIGTISATPPVGERFALAGRVWEVEEVDVAKKLVFAKGVEGKMKISWPGDRGAIHTRILKRMRRILSETDDFPYLMPAAKERLAKARALARNTGLCQKTLLSLGPTAYVFFPWLGTRGFDALKRILQRQIAPKLGLYDIQSGGCYYITFRSETASSHEILKEIRKEAANPPAAESLIGKTEYPVYDKYDACLPRTLALRAYAENYLDVDDFRREMICRDL